MKDAEPLTGKQAEGLFKKLVLDANIAGAPLNLEDVNAEAEVIKRQGANNRDIDQLVEYAFRAGRLKGLADAITGETEFSASDLETFADNIIASGARSIRKDNGGQILDRK
jgi:hypothetical protein